MHLRVMSPTQPPDVERLVIVLVMCLYLFRSSTFLTWLALYLASLYCLVQFITSSYLRCCALTVFMPVFLEPSVIPLASLVPITLSIRAHVFNPITRH